MNPDRWLAVVAGVPDSAAGLVAAELVRAGARAAVERADGTLVTHFPPPTDVPAFLAALGGELNRVAGHAVHLRWHWQPHEEWTETWRRGLRVLTALLPGFADILAPGGWLLVSGLLAEESGDFAYEAAPRGFRLRDDDAEDGWWAGTFRLVPGPADG